jgi:hypothetical protein
MKPAAPRLVFLVGHLSLLACPAALSVRQGTTHDTAFGFMAAESRRQARVRFARRDMPPVTR